MANDYRMTNTRGDVLMVRSSDFVGGIEYENAGARFAVESGHPVLVVDQTDGDRYVGIYGADPLPEDYDQPTHWRLREDNAKVAEWEEWAAGHALAEAFIVEPFSGENVAWREARNVEQRARAMRRRYVLLYRAARRRTGKQFPELTEALIEALDAARRAERVMQS